LAFWFCYSHFLMTFSKDVPLSIDCLELLQQSKYLNKSLVVHSKKLKMFSFGGLFFFFLFSSKIIYLSYACLQLQHAFKNHFMARIFYSKMWFTRWYWKSLKETLWKVSFKLPLIKMLAGLTLVGILRGCFFILEMTVNMCKFLTFWNLPFKDENNFPLLGCKVWSLIISRKI
jgi:hypothetical protein